jgi:hypothetical protein
LVSLDEAVIARFKKEEYHFEDTKKGTHAPQDSLPKF